MRIAFNSLSASHGAGLSVFSAILPRISQRAPRDRYVLFYSSRQQKIADAVSDGFLKIRIDYLPANAVVRILWEQIALPLYLLRFRIDVLYSVGNTTSILAPCRIVLLIENANPFSLIFIKQSAGERLRNALLYVLSFISAWRAQRVRFVSENSHRLIAPRLRLSERKCSVVPHGVDRQRFSSLHSDVGRPHHSPYILAVGVNAQHRNISRLLKAFSLLSSRFSYEGDLILLGYCSSRYRMVLDNEIRSLNIEGRVFFKGELVHEKMVAYYLYADVLAAPSLEETFGIPLIEAMCSGVPVAAADCDEDISHRGKCFNPCREICGPAAAYFNPFDSESIARVIFSVLNDSQYRESLVFHGKNQAVRYDLDATVGSLMRLLGSTVSRVTIES